MDSVKVNGKLYLKAAVLAKQFRYTTDYIGQLCRNKKVDCQFIGRSWYVTEASLLAHKDTRYKEVRINEKTIKNNALSGNIAPEISVRPRLLKTAQRNHPSSHFAERLIPRESKYFADEADLLPVPAKVTTTSAAAVPKIIPIIPVAATPIAVKSEDSSKKLDFTELPAISLHGVLTVSEVVADETVSQPVYIPTVKPIPNASQIEHKPKIAPKQALAIPKRSFADKLNADKINYAPKSVVTEQAITRMWPLVLLALLMSGLLFGFITTATTEFFVGKNNTQKRVIFELDGLMHLIENTR